MKKGGSRQIVQQSGGDQSPQEVHHELLNESPCYLKYQVRATNRDLILNSPDPSTFSEVISLPFDAFAKVEKQFSALGMWLHYQEGFAREKTNMFLKAIQIVLVNFLVVFRMTMMANRVDVQIPTLNIPCDVRTAFSRNVEEPVFKRIMCCPKCFCLYPDQLEAPPLCTWKPSSGSDPCDTDLWRQKNTRKGVETVPRCYYTTQDFDEWLKFFLSRQVVDDGLQKAHKHITEHPLMLDAEMTDVWDSPMYRDLYQGTQSPYNLRFAIFTDGFAVHKLKIAGTKLYLK